MISRLLLGTVTLAAWFSGGTAVAQTGAADVSGEAAIGNLRYELIDLTPDDGATPWLNLEPLYSSASVRIGEWDEGGPSDSLQGEGTLELADAGSSVYALIDGDGLRARSVAGQRDVDIRTDSSIGFTFSPNTRVIFMADAEVNAAAQSHAFNHSYASLSGIVYGANGDVTSNSHVTTSSGPGEQSVLLELIFRSADVTTSGHLSLGASTWSQVSAVPEPAQVSLLLFGVGAVAAAARRRRDQPPGRTAPA